MKNNLKLIVYNPLQYHQRKFFFLVVSNLLEITNIARYLTQKEKQIINKSLCLRTTKNYQFLNGIETYYFPKVQKELETQFGLSRLEVKWNCSHTTLKSRNGQINLINSNLINMLILRNFVLTQQDLINSRVQSMSPVGA